MHAHVRVFLVRSCLADAAAVSPACAVDLAGATRLGGKAVRRRRHLARGPGAAAAGARAEAVLEQRDLQFFPRVLVVQVGTKVRFPNDDRVFHNVFSYHDGTKFDLGLYPVGAVQRRAVQIAGLSRIFCNIHPQMAAYVMVVDTPYFAVSDAQGQFVITGVPAGHVSLPRLAARRRDSHRLGHRGFRRRVLDRQMAMSLVRRLVALLLALARRPAARAVAHVGSRRDRRRLDRRRRRRRRQIRLFGTDQTATGASFSKRPGPHDESGSDAFGAAYPYDRDAAADGDVRRATVPARGAALVGSRRPLPRAVRHLRPERSRLQRLPARAAHPVRQRTGRSRTRFSKRGVDVLAGRPSLYSRDEPRARRSETRGVRAAAGARHGDPRAGVLRSLIVGASYLHTQPSRTRPFVQGDMEFGGVDARWMRGGVQLRGEWIGGRPFDGVATRGGYVDARPRRAHGTRHRGRPRRAARLRRRCSSRVHPPLHRGRAPPADLSLRGVRQRPASARRSCQRAPRRVRRRRDLVACGSEAVPLTRRILRSRGIGASRRACCWASRSWPALSLVAVLAATQASSRTTRCSGRAKTSRARARRSTGWSTAARSLRRANTPDRRAADVPRAADQREVGGRTPATHRSHGRGRTASKLDANFCVVTDPRRRLAWPDEPSARARRFAGAQSVDCRSQGGTVLARDRDARRRAVPDRLRARARSPTRCSGTLRSPIASTTRSRANWRWSRIATSTSSAPTAGCAGAVCRQARAPSWRRCSTPDRIDPGRRGRRHCVSFGGISYIGGVFPLRAGGSADLKATLVLLQDWTPTERALARIEVAC